MNNKPNIIKKLEDLKYELIQGYSENGFYINDIVWVQRKETKKVRVNKRGSKKILTNKDIIEKQNVEVKKIIDDYVSNLNIENNDIEDNIPWFLRNDNDDFSKKL